MSSLIKDLEKKYFKGNHVHAAIIELTEACPCRCVHCYLIKNPQNELTLDEIKDYLAQLCADGAFHLHLTGGDPLVRKDFPEILAAAAKHQFMVTVLTSGLPVDADMADLLARHKVGCIEMSLLGDNAETHDKLMKHPGSFDKIIEACRLLTERRLRLVLKATIMQGNYTELAGMSELAKQLRVGFSASITLAPRVDGDLQPLSLALTEQQLATVDPTLLYGGLVPGEDYQEGGLLTCRAGITAVSISSTGDVFPCILFRRKIGNLRERTFKDIWHDNPDPFLTELRGVRAEDINTCPTCTVRKHCKRCPGVAWLETGKLREPSPSYCKIAEGLANSPWDK